VTWELIVKLAYQAGLTINDMYPRGPGMRLKEILEYIESHLEGVRDETDRQYRRSAHFTAQIITTLLPEGKRVRPGQLYRPIHEHSKTNFNQDEKEWFKKTIDRQARKTGIDPRKKVTIEELLARKN